MPKITPLCLGLAPVGPVWARLDLFGSVWPWFATFQIHFQGTLMYQFAKWATRFQLNTLAYFRNPIIKWHRFIIQDLGMDLSYGVTKQFEILTFGT